MRLPSNRTARSFQELAVIAKDELFAAQLVTPDTLAEAAMPPVALDCFCAEQDRSGFPLGAAGGHAVEHDKAVPTVERACGPPRNSGRRRRMRRQDAAQMRELRRSPPEETSAAGDDGERHRLFNDVDSVDLELQGDAVPA